MQAWARGSNNVTEIPRQAWGGFFSFSPVEENLNLIFSLVFFLPSVVSTVYFRQPPVEQSPSTHTSLGHGDVGVSLHQLL